MQVFGRSGGNQVAELMDEADKCEDVFGRVAVVHLGEEVPLKEG